MFKHYIITAYKVLLRRKFFTFVNLFGIALTLAVLTVVIAMLENFVRPFGAERTAEHFVAVRDVALRDSADENHQREWSSRPGFKFIQRHVLTLKEPDNIGLVSGPEEGTIFLSGRKLSPDVAHTDGGYWEILDFTFLEGRPISTADTEEGRFVAVINAAMRDEIFDGQPAVGQTVVVNGQRFEVIGVVANESEMRMYAYAEIWVPHTTFPSTSYRDQWLGDFVALLYAEEPGRIPVLQDEFFRSLETFEYDDPEEFTVALSHADTKLDRLAREFLDTRYQRDSKAGWFLLILMGGMLAFMVLPTVNLVNLNVSRILERASEIGVRKAFGASGRILVGQFLVENLVLSIAGGLVGFVLGIVLTDVLELSGLMAYAEININLRVFVAAFFTMAVFGALSGAYPAWKMSRLNPVDALRGGTPS